MTACPNPKLSWELGLIPFVFIIMWHPCFNHNSHVLVCVWQTPQPAICQFLSRHLWWGQYRPWYLCIFSELSIINRFCRCYKLQGNMPIRIQQSTTVVFLLVLILPSSKSVKLLTSLWSAGSINIQWTRFFARARRTRSRVLPLCDMVCVGFVLVALK